MATFETQLVRRELVAEGTMAFYFEKPSTFRHQAGQSLTMTLINPPETDEEGDTRTFTVASAPHEPHLMIATRMRDTAFKRVIGSTRLGMVVRIDGPDGVMVLHNDAARPAVLLSGGIGITPFLSMARHAAQQKLALRLYLFYSNRRPEDAAFLEELQKLELMNPNYRLIATMTKPEKSSHQWTGETGYIGPDMLERHLPNLKTPIYYFAGPPVMTMAIRSMLETIGVTEDDMKSEEFYGY